KIISAIFLAEDDDEMIEDSEIEEVEYNLNIIELEQGVFDFNSTELAADLVKE
ncbi:9142_t:CDS:2, partial [Scutellospora calospora]